MDFTGIFEAGKREEKSKINRWNLNNNVIGEVIRVAHGTISTWEKLYLIDISCGNRFYTGWINWKEIKSNDIIKQCKSKIRMNLLNEVIT